MTSEWGKWAGARWWALRCLKSWRDTVEKTDNRKWAGIAGRKQNDVCWRRDSLALEIEIRVKKKKKNEYQEMVWGYDIVHLNRKGNERRENKAESWYFQVSELIYAFMLFAVSLSSLSKILEQEKLTILSTLIHCHCYKLWALYVCILKYNLLFGTEMNIKISRLKRVSVWFVKRWCNCWGLFFQILIVRPK